MSDPTRAITTKQQFIDYTTWNWNDLTTFLDGLSDEQWLDPRDAEGWSVKDHAAHITRWDRAEIEHLRNGVPLAQTAGISDDVWSSGLFTTMNKEIRQSTVADSVEKVKTDRDATWRDLVILMNELTEEQMQRHGAAADLPMAGHETVRTAVQVLAEYFGTHYAEHLAHLKTFVEGQEPKRPQTAVS